MWNQVQIWIQHKIREWAFQNVITPIEAIDIIRGDGLAEHDILAQVNVLQEFSVIDAALAKELGIYKPETINERKEYVDTHGQKHLADVIPVSFTLQEEERTSRWLVVDRHEEPHLVLLGKQDVADFYIFVQATQ